LLQFAHVATGRAASRLVIGDILPLERFFLAARTREKYPQTA